MAKIKATKQDIPNVVFLDNQVEDKSKNTSIQDNEIATIEIEQERIRIEQAKIISIVPANTNTSNQWTEIARTRLKTNSTLNKTSFKYKTTHVNNTIYNIKTTHHQSLLHQHNH